MTEQKNKFSTLYQEISKSPKLQMEKYPFRNEKKKINSCI